ncbi:MAG: DNA/RNA non-specific endonuclease [Prevotella sp.]|nr:DNA/RNA non-specific endonuclease [Prevotella sp.]
MKKTLLIEIVVLLSFASCLKDKRPSTISKQKLSGFYKKGKECELDAAFLCVSPDGYVIRRKGYVTSYNTETKNPNWVAWHLTAEHTDGDVPRLNNYFEDEDVPLPRATDDDYRRSGWTHGHMCPAADNKWNEVAMRESCLLTNICPQDGSLNSGLWNTIEGNCRQWARKYGDVYIVCGPVFLNREHETIGENKVVVPEAFFKVILCLQGTPKAIGFVVRNNEGKKKKDQFVNTVDDVERITGYDFFPALPDSIEDVVEAYANIKEW